MTKQALIGLGLAIVVASFALAQGQETNDLTYRFIDFPEPDIDVGTHLEDVTTSDRIDSDDHSFQLASCCSHGDAAPSQCCNSCGCKSRRRCRTRRCCGPSPYASVILAGSFMHLRSGGFNTVGLFPNTGDGNSEEFDIGGAIGLRIPRNWGSVRIEAEGMARDMFDGVTNSFRPPTPTFFYRMNVNDRWTALANVWLERPVSRRVDIYLGGGIGTGGGRIAANDFVVQGAGSFTESVWQLGGGMSWRRCDRLTFDIGYRYVDYGRANLNLASVVGNVPAGNYALNQMSHQITLGFRFNSIGDFLPRS